GHAGRPAYLAPDLDANCRRLHDPARVKAWIDGARAALARGEPLFALALGRDLHWADAPEHRVASLDLMTCAYRALGREALARIAEVHHAHRDQPMVAVFSK